MKNRRIVPVLAATLLAFGSAALAVQSEGKKKSDNASHKDKEHKEKALEIGAKVPDFSATDASGKTVKFSDFAGKTVVLEWVNPGCPVCRKVTEGGQVAKMIADAKAIDPNVVFLMVNSTAAMASKPAETTDYLSKNKVAPTAALIDGDGKVGHLFGAKTTPHMFVVDSKGTLVYEGAFDDSEDRGDTPGKTNYVINALQQLKDGKAVSPSTTKAYGCSVKYGKK